MDHLVDHKVGCTLNESLYHGIQATFGLDL